jgi:serine/threonine-protein kinase
MTSAHAPGSQGNRARNARAARSDPQSEGEVAKEDVLLGRVIAGKYHIEDLLGEGAMGRVYRARQTVLDKPIAIKVLHRHLTGESRIEKRFHREARAASRLSHPNSLQILDFGSTEDGMLYIAMELLDGEDLQTVLDHDFPLSPARLGSILIPVLRAVEEAHRAGIIHRDLKPENIVVLSDRSGREHVKVCDFGIAKILDGEDGQSITVDGFVCGTPQYMAPEQARGEAIDHRSDIYAAGVMLYQMLTGTVPFTGDNALGIITKHLMEEPVPPRRRRPDLGIPAALEEVCLRAMKKNPAERYPSAAEMADALDLAIRNLGRDAEHRLGEGPFRPAAVESVEVDAPEPLSTGTSTIERAIAQSSRRPRIAAAVAITAIALGGAALAVWAARDEGGSDSAPAEAPRGHRADDRGGADRRAADRSAGDRSTRAADPSAGDRSTRAAGAAEGAAPGSGAAEAPPDALAGAAESGATVGAAAERGAAPASVGAAAERGAAPASGEPVNERPRGRGRSDRAPDGTPGANRAISEAEAPTSEHAPGPPTRSPGEVAFDEGRRLFLANDVAGAIRRFEEAARLMPQSAEVHKQLGRAYMRAGDVQRGIAAYRRYLTLAPHASDRAVVERIIAQHGG